MVNRAPIDPITTNYPELPNDNNKNDENPQQVDDDSENDIQQKSADKSLKSTNSTALPEPLYFLASTKFISSLSKEEFRTLYTQVEWKTLKSKQLFKGIDQLMDEGVAQLFTLELNGRKVIGTVGAWQYEVIQYRLEHEYGAKCTYENLNVYKACWVDPKESKSEEYKEFVRVKQRYLAKDKQNQLVFLADSAFSLQMTQQKYPKIKFHFTSEF